ncbi:MAG: PhnD/SsuA/transferrin family substrate-binding protein [Planctomycetes bacterium]|nr:PhnD/SsuA/transferrin family substrate-binding protein [Planctomycetota bacterium]
MTRPLMLGAVAYDPKVVTIWEGFKQWFGGRGLAFDYMLYSNYERQVEGHLAGQYDVAWNSPLAWIELERAAKKIGRSVQAIAMRDTDCDLTSVVVVREDAGIGSLDDLRGKTIGVGASDSPQATLIPLHFLATQGLDPESACNVRRFEIGVGLHGDHIGGERHAAKALMQGEVDAACMIDGNHLLFSTEGTLPPGKTRILAQTGTYDHCNFSVFDDSIDDRVTRFRELLLGMRYDDPEVRPLLDLEGLKEWRPGRTSGYALLEAAVDRTGAIDDWLGGSST